ncbi:uncharacterized protein M6B38_153125 [Iris pallida]|uniref:Uncharacterized protein n=1 Tax=Iris pallida TaxID=29817 RepID=A0AAX6F4Y6_IRIPA|nr:uncharacterized protein M6B38_153125 [Iris pallida]
MILIKSGGSSLLLMSMLQRRLSNARKMLKTRPNLKSLTLGRKSYNRVYEELEEEHPGQGVRRSEAWKRAHKNKATGNVLPCALEKYNEIEAAEKRQKLAVNTSGDGVPSIEDFENDPIAEVFGADKRSRCRAVSSTSSTKQVKIGQAAKAIANKNSNPEVIQRLNSLEGMVREVLTYVYTSHKSQNPTFGSGTPEAEGASDNMHIPITPRNLNPVLNNTVSPGENGNNGGHVVHDKNGGPTSGGKTNVVLRGRGREDVAKGFLASHTICHGREVQDDEKIVYVSEVIKPEASVYDGPQNGISLLCELVDGGYIIWGGGRIRYL